MCLKNVYYPLVKLNTGKQKVLFKYPFVITDRDEACNLTLESNEWKWARFGNSRIQSFNKCYAENPDIDYFVKMIQVPCGSCSECLANNSRSWAFRILQEASLHDNNFFVTLTYDDDHVPATMMLEKDAISKFNKKLRTYLDRKGLDSSFRFYGVGEYGSNTARPHYHVIYFGLDIPDLKYEYSTENGDLIFSSKFLEETWSNGFVTIGSVDVGSACYVARYCDKKKRLSKSEKEKLIEKNIVPEFSIMSRMPGIGSQFLDNALASFERGIYNFYVKGVSYSLPLYYTKKIKELLADTPELKAYEEHARYKQVIAISKQLDLADVVGDVSLFKQKQDKIKTCRKL